MAASYPKPTATVYPAPYPLPAGVPACTYPVPLPQPLGPAPPYSAIALFFRVLISVSSIAAFLLSGALAFAVWLNVHPYVTEFSVSSASVSNLNISLSPSWISAAFDVTLSACNPNTKLGIFYHDVSAAVVCGDHELAETSLPKFYQNKLDSTLLRARMAAVSAVVGPDNAVQISGNLSRHDTVRFQVWAKASVQFNAGLWKTKKKMMVVHCDGVAFSVCNGTRMIGSVPPDGSPKSCTVNLGVTYA